MIDIIIKIHGDYFKYFRKNLKNKENKLDAHLSKEIESTKHFMKEMSNKGN